MEATKEKKSIQKTRQIVLAVLAVISIAAIIVVCIVQTNFYKTHFLPNTYINGADCSKLDAKAAAGILEEEMKAYNLVLMGRDETGAAKELGTIFAEEISLELKDSAGEVKILLEQQSPADWFASAFGNKEQHLNIVHAVTYDEQQLENCVKQLEAFQEMSMIAPKDAYISEYREEIKGCEIVPEIMGTQLNTDSALSCIKAMITAGAAEVNLEEQGCYKAPQVFSDSKELLAELEQVNRWLCTKITYDWNTFEVIVDNAVIKDWIVSEEGKLKLDEEAIGDFVAKKASEYDTYMRNKK